MIYRYIFTKHSDSFNGIVCCAIYITEISASLFELFITAALIELRLHGEQPRLAMT